MKEHGGNIYRAAELSGLPEEKILDFSASINPLGISKTVSSVIKKSIAQLRNYPEPEAEKLRAGIARHLDINPEAVICGNGSTELIYLVARALRPERVLIPAPTFSEYERACKISCKAQVTRYKLSNKNNFDINVDEFIKTMEKMSKPKIQNPKSKIVAMAFLCNPNNPTGRLINKNAMLKIVAAAEKLNCYLTVDEAFMDFIPEESIAGEVRKNRKLIVLRSMTKFYALSGLRLGYGIFPLPLAKLLRQSKEPWTVNSLAEAAGIAAINDDTYRLKTFGLIKREKRFMEKAFERLGIVYAPSETNYYLLRLNKAKSILKKLGTKGVILRDCSNFTGLDHSYIRVAVKSRRDNAVLIKELSVLCRG